MNKKIISIVILIIISISYTAFGQSEFIQKQRFRGGVHFKTWSFDNAANLDKFTEVAFPVVYSMPLSRRLSVVVVTSPFLSRVSPGTGQNLNFDNLSDTFVRGSYLIGEDLALLTVGVGIPTGETNLNADELAIAGLAANRPLDNPVTNFGTGLNITFGLAIAREVGSWVAGLGFGYSFRQEYDVNLNNLEQKIQPGNEFNITVGFEKEFEVSEGRGKFTADFIYTNYSGDELGGLPFFEAGDKFLARAQFIVPVGIFDPVIFSATNRLRLDNTTTNAAFIDNGNELELRATLFHPFSDTFSLKYIVDLTIYGNTANQSEGAFIYGVGLGTKLKLSNRVSFDPSVIFSKGSINSGPDSEIDITGLEFSGGLSFTF